MKADAYTTLESLSTAMSGVMTNLPRKEVKPRVQVRKVISLEEMIDKLHKRIEQSVKISFKELLENNSEKAHVIVGFLAVLESVKQGSILAAQSYRFADIHIEKYTITAPKYY